MKKVYGIVFSVMLIIVGLFANEQTIDAVNENMRTSNKTIYHQITYIGGGKTPYTENGTLYYQSNNVIQLDVILPAGSNSLGIAEVIQFDTNKLELLSSYTEIKNSLSFELINCTWENLVGAYNGNKDQIYLDSIAVNPIHSSQNTSGGIVASIQFRIKELTTTTTGTEIAFNFKRFEMVGFVGNDFGYIHDGYDANDASTIQIELPTFTINAGKKQIVAPPSNENEKPSTIPEGSPIDSNVTLDHEVVEEIVENEIISDEVLAEIQQTIKEKEYDFDLENNESINGVDGYDSIIDDVLTNFNKIKEDENYKTFTFSSDKKTDVVNKLVETSVMKMCVTHWILLGTSLLVILGTLYYVKYNNHKFVTKWRAK